MAHLDVYVHPDSVTYDPNPPDVKQWDTVSFTLVDRTDEVTVTFDDGTPLVTDVNGTQVAVTNVGLSASLTTQQLSVSATAAKKVYSFYFPKHVSDREPKPDQPGTVTGELDVTTDPPK